MATLKIYRSSAGAGKTHTLVIEYLKLALDHPERFSQILAVTFTNQATQEMKQRILVYLHSLAQGLRSPVAEVLLQDKGWDYAILQERSQAVLSNMLHQYTRFSVSTIDSFFQKVIRGFMQELGLQSGFRVELEQASVLDTTIDAMVASAGQDKQLQRWLVAFAEDKLLRGKSWNFKRELAALGQALFTESFGVHETQLVRATRDPAVLRQFLRRLHQHIVHFEQGLQRFGQQASAFMEQVGLAVDDFSYGKAGVMGYLVGLATKRRWKPPQRALYALQHVEAWYCRTADNRALIKQVVQSVLQPCLKDVLHFYDTYHRIYYTALAVKHFVYAFGIITNLLDKLKDYRASHNVMLVSDTSLLLRQIIAESDTPFVYEKMGAFYNHFLIDEFQDISWFQWQNLQPLIANSLHAGYTSMVVGDVKQSIYRWRGGDWRLLLTQLEKDVMETNVVTLNQNWRSKQHIIDFNNAFFARAADMLAQHWTDVLAKLEDPMLKEDLQAQVQQLSAAYKEVSQQLPTQRVQADKGYIRITFLEESSEEEVSSIWHEEVKARLPCLIETLQQDGFMLKDIALLVRSNAEGRAIFRTLLSYKQSSQAKKDYRYDVVASESLYLSHNPWIKLLINAIGCLVDETNTIAQAELSYLYQWYVLKGPSDALHQCFQAEEGMLALPKAFTTQKPYLKHLPLYELVEALIGLFKLRCSGSMAFLQAFQDVVLDFTAREIVDIDDFLAWWEEQGGKYTLPRSAEQDTMTLMTIHQAKGLQFKVVILPFCSWDLDHNIHRPPTLWCTTDTPPFDQFSVLPVRYSARLQDTLYARAYYEEQMQTHLDHLNLLYVAFTRPIDRLYVFAQHPAKTALKNTSDLLYSVFATTQSTTHEPSIFKNAWNRDTGIFEIGATQPAATY